MPNHLPTSPTGHSNRGASSSKRWMKCPRSVKASEGLPNESSPWAAEGTMLHDVAANALMTYRGDASAAIKWADLATLTSEQITVVQQYVDTIRRDTEWGEGERWQEFIIEERVGMPALHPDFWGTNDTTIVRKRKLTVYDLKCGAGVNVEVDDENGEINPQLGYYLLGVIVRLGGEVSLWNIALPEGVDDLEIVIVQPRLGGVKRRMVAVTELMDLARDLTLGAILSERDDAPMLGGDHCRFCPARRGADGKRCAGLVEAARKAARAEFGAPPPPDSMDDETLADVLNHADTIETWLQAVKDEARDRMQRGEIAPGWKLNRGRAGNRAWVDQEIARIALIEWGFDADLIAPRKLVSPAEAERLAKVHLGEAIDLADMVERKPAVGSVEREKAAAEFAPVAEETPDTGPIDLDALFAA